jgi:hypothetical protein
MHYQSEHVVLHAATSKHITVLRPVTYPYPGHTMVLPGRQMTISMIHQHA